jgi:hypothetical protein
MNKTTYEEFIQNVLDTRGRFNCGDTYHERHHIVPKCIGGGNEKENLIDLYAREHFIAHKLLAQENPENDKLIYAWTCMAFTKNDIYYECEITPEEYEEARIVLSEKMTGEGNHFYGKHHSEETKEKLRQQRIGTKASDKAKYHMSEAQTKRMQDPDARAACGKPHTEEWKREQSERMRGENHPMYGKHHSEETKEKISKAQTGKVMPEEFRQKMSELTSGENNPMYGKHHTEETKEKLSRKLRGRKVPEDVLQKINEARPRGEKHSKARCVVQLNKDGTFVCEWAYIRLAGKTLNISESHISACCRNERKSAGGFVWKYKEDWEGENKCNTN